MIEARNPDRGIFKAIFKREFLRTPGCNFLSPNRIKHRAVHRSIVKIDAVLKCGPHSFMDGPSRGFTTWMAGHGPS